VRRFLDGPISSPGKRLVLACLALALAGCSMASSPGGDTAALVRESGASLSAASTDDQLLLARDLSLSRATVTDGPLLLAKAGTATEDPADSLGAEETLQYDPWEPFNEKMFAFNRAFDRWLLKPVAEVYDKAIPDLFKIMIENGFRNLLFVHRAVNNILQAQLGDAGLEVARFLINSTAGVGGLFDPARDFWGIERPPPRDFGLTLGVWGVSQGPYLILPFLPPLTVRDGIGRAVDGAMNPLDYVIPFFPHQISLQAGEVVNDRALNLELFQGFEESALDLYSAVRDAYLQRRAEQLRRGLRQEIIIEKKPE
jgi:phospholipid-binding lipoprotein MlaA